MGLKNKLAVRVVTLMPDRIKVMVVEYLVFQLAGNVRDGNVANKPPLDFLLGEFVFFSFLLAGMERKKAEELIDVFATDANEAAGKKPDDGARDQPSYFVPPPFPPPNKNPFTTKN